jgi:Zn ribbon nucleic-acid-binding protein
MSIDSNRREIAREAKAIVALAFRNGPIEQFHAGKPCPTCAGHDGFSRITEEQMALIMKNAVDHVYHLLLLKEEDPVEYERQVRFGEQYTANWDEPEIPKRPRRDLAP